MTELRVFLNTWGNYNENGADGGEWIALPCDDLEEKMDKLAAAMGDNDPEWFVNDYEWEGIDLFEVSEYSNIEDLNKQLEEFAYLNEYEQKTVAALLEAGCYSKLQDAIDSVDRCYFRADVTIEDLAYEEAEKFLHDVPDIVKRHFDYGSFADELKNYYTETSYGVICDW